VLFVSAVVIPALLIFVMRTVGLEFIIPDLRRAATFAVPIVLALAASESLLGNESIIDLPLAGTILQLLLGPVLPFGAGMLITAVARNVASRGQVRWSRALSHAE
jgi:hypothetical protein